MDRILLISFLEQVRRTDIKVFVFAALFLFAQLFLTFIKLEFTPFFLYGMYSEKAAVTDTFSTLNIVVNNKPIEYYSPLRESDMLKETAANFEEMKANNYTDPLKMRIESRYPFVYNSVLYPFISTKIYNSKKAMDDYRVWLKKKCLQIAGTENGNVLIVRTVSILNKTTLQLNPVKNEILEDL
jgi:hypothetical protein